MTEIFQFPPQLLPFSRKNKKWRCLHLDWASSKATFSSSPVRKSVLHKKINYDLINGKLHMEDLVLIINPDGILAGFIPDKILHYPIMNSKIDVLKGEELARIFDYKVVITNPNGISEIENNKKEELFLKLQQLVSNTALSEEEFNAELEKLNEYITYEWQDLREIRGNALLRHYEKELNMPLMFNGGFADALTVAEEAYMCDIVGGEPTVTKVNPLKLRIFRSGHSNKIEDADVVVYEDYWSPGKIVDTFYDVLTADDMRYIENIAKDPAAGEEGFEPDPRLEFLPLNGYIGDDEVINPNRLFQNNAYSSLMPYDTYGNIRVIKIFWKSRRKIKKVKYYDLVTGEELFDFYPENYVIDETRGEEEETLWINEAWEGTKIGEKIYVNMRPRLVQYNRLSNPSRCHFGIIGTIYNLNEDKPFSLVDKMKPYNYLYDAIHDRLNKLLAKNWGKIITLDLAKVPQGWDIDKWLYFAKTNNIAVIDSFKEGNVGAATGKIAGGLNNASSGVIDAELSNTVQYTINLLEFLKLEMADVAGISKQREGLISNRETVGGVERATLLSTHITEWLFATHDDVKRRVLECFLETAKIALRGGSKKFLYILSDGTSKIIDIDGDEFAECDYGLVVDNSRGTQELSQKLDMLAQAALQTQTLNFSTIMKLYSSSSIAEKQRMVEKNEMDLMQRQLEAQQQLQQLEQQKMQADAQLRELDMQLKDLLNLRDNETKIMAATISANSQQINSLPEFSEESQAKFLEAIREFDEKMALEKEKFEEQKRKNKADEELKLKSINKKPLNSNK